MNATRLSLPAVLVGALAACGNNAGGVDAPTEPDATVDPGVAARTRFREVLETRRFVELPGALDQLRAANAAAPHDRETVLTLALADLWGASEWGRDPAQGAQAQARILEALQLFPEAMELRPDDHRINGWLGPSLIGTGEQIGNPEMVAQGAALLAAGVEAYPEFNLFVHGLVYARYPVGSPELASAVDAYMQTIDICFGPVTADDPDITAYTGNETTVGVKRVCWNGPLSVHNFEGYFLHMGDTLTKGGRVAAARVSYENATLLPSHATWPYRTVLADRLATLDARAALYADADPTNDPALISQTEDTCSSCHARE